jgi:5'-nucleotidase
MRASTGADIAFMNPGGIRADLVAHRAGRPDFAVTYADAFQVQPFQNALITMTLTGAQIEDLLQHQFGSRSDPRILQVSSGFSYRYAYDRATHQGVVSAIRVNGRNLDPKKTYRIVVPSFLAGGGDAFLVLRAGVDPRPGAIDVDALATYLGKKSSPEKPFDPPTNLQRIVGDGCK